MATSRFMRMARLTNARVCVNEGGKSATVKLPGLSLDDFNRTGGIGIWRVLHWFTWSRIAAYHAEELNGHGFLEYNKMTTGVLTFMASTSTTVNDAFYRLLDSADPPELSVQFHLGYIGTSSLNTVAVLSDAKSGSELAINVNQVVSIDRETRKPTPLPEWWTTKYGSYVIENERLVLPLLEVPTKNTYKYSMKVSWNDIDAYKHVNYQSYVKFCFDAAMDAINNQYYSAFQGDIFNYNVKTIKSAYKGESHAGDMITVVTWQHSETPLVLYFSIQKDVKVIFQSSVEFFAA